MAGSVLLGCGGNNQGLRLRVLQDQPRGAQGPVRGSFVILDSGDNRHSDSLRELLNQVTNAQEVIGIIRRQGGSCVSVANTNILTVEQD